MSDPLRTDTSRALDGSSGADRDAKIEQLLLLGLDHYFAAQYDQAINVWTRALFLDRSHPRARAYIERARSALAERQRESEELLHSGADAIRRGDAEHARELLLAAIDHGAPRDEAAALLDRLTRAEALAPPRGERTVRTPAPAPKAHARHRRSAAAWLFSAVLIAALAGAVVIGIHWRELSTSALGDRTDPGRPAAAPLTRDALPPPVRPSEIVLARARALAASGHLHDALDLLDGVRPTDPLRGEADKLRVDVQRQLLAVAPMPPAVASRPPRPLP